MIPRQAPYPEERNSAATAAVVSAVEVSSRAALVQPPALLDEQVAGRERLVGRLRNVWQRRGTVARITCAGFVFSAAAAFLIPRQYESVTHLMPPDQANAGAGLAMIEAASSGVGSGLGSLAGGILGLKSSGALFIGILQSRTVQDDIVREFRLQKVYGDRYTEDARKDLANHSSIFEDRKSGIITVQVTDFDPKRAAGIAREYTEELDRVVNQMSTSSAHREREFLEGRLAAVQTGLARAEKDFSEFASRNATIDLQAQGKAMIEGAATLQGRLIAAESELQGLKQIYTDDNVRVRSVRAQIDELKAQLDKIGGGNPGTGTQAGGTSADPNYPSIRRLPLLGVTYTDLYRQTKVQEAVFETLTREYELAKVQEVKETPSVKVLDPANVPEKKSFPPRLLIIFLGTCFALLVALVWLLLRTLWDEADPEDPRREFALEIYRDAASHLSWQALNTSFASLASRKALGRPSTRHGAPVERR